MTAQEYLSQYGDMLKEERRLLREIAELRERALSFGSSWHGENYLQDIAEKDEDGNVRRHTEYSTAFMSSGSGRNTSMMQVDAYIDKERDRLNKARANAMALRMEISAAIGAVEDARYRDVLSARYLSLISLEDYAATVPCGRTTAYRWHMEALNCIIVPAN